MEFLKDQPLYSHTTMKLGGLAKYLCTVTTEDEVIEAANFAKSNGLKIIVIGGGSNIIFNDDGFNGLVILNNLKGLSINSSTRTLTAATGEAWDDVVKAAVEANLSGIESLSLIPGTMGGAPVNNIGAYGQEIKHTLKHIKAYDTKESKFILLNNSDCKFAYRDSIFKSTEHGRYIITEVTLLLKNADEYQPPAYASLQSSLLEAGIKKPTIQDIRNAVINIRSAKLPDPKLIPNTGSFFKNPIVSNQKRDELLEKFPSLAYFDYHGKTKLAAGWLIDNAGLKGYEQDGIKVYEKQALVLVNIGTRSYKSLENMKSHIINVIKEKYGVELEVEPELK